MLFCYKIKDITTKVLWWSSWAHRSSWCIRLICSSSHSFLFRLPRTWHLMSNSVDVSRKALEAHPTGEHGSCSHFLWESELFICLCFFVRFIIFFLFHVLCSLYFLCIAVIPKLRSFWLLFQVRILVSLVSLCSLVIIKDFFLSPILPSHYSPPFSLLAYFSPSSLSHILIFF